MTHSKRINGLHIQWSGYLYIYHLSLGQWPDLKAIHSNTTDWWYRLPIWVERSKDTYLWSPSSFFTIIYSGTIISFLPLSCIYSFFLHLHFYCACWLSVCDWHSISQYLKSSVSFDNYRQLWWWRRWFRTMDHRKNGEFKSLRKYWKGWG